MKFILYLRVHTLVYHLSELINKIIDEGSNPFSINRINKI